MQVIKYPERKAWEEICKRPVLDISSLEISVNNVLDEIRENGAKALKHYTSQFDKVSIDNPEVSSLEIEEAIALIPRDLKDAMLQAKQNIEKFHARQLEQTEIIETMPGVRCWRKSLPIEKVGLYIPGGTAPLFSTLLMLGIPAMLAGCKEVIVCSPPNNEEKLHPAILYAASLTGITRVFKAGGVQAIGAMAFGTTAIPKVYKIFGPGNQYVTCAKQLVQKYGVAIDMPAGPSEVAVFADATANPVFVAADLLSQAEHGADSQVLLVCSSEQLIEKVIQELSRQIKDLTRGAFASKALENSKIVLVKDEQQAIELLNEYAAEHLILSCKDAEQLSEKVVNAGSVFLGHYSPESVGDYASGTNHTLPTNGYARTYSGVSVDSFVKKVTFQQLTKEGLKNIGPTVEILAAAEGLDAHKNSVSLRLREIMANG
ncbi:MAG: histidinol dehydrogenase [Chitinophagaceae bacterium]